MAKREEELNALERAARQKYGSRWEFELRRLTDSYTRGIVEDWGLLPTERIEELRLRINAG